MKLYTCTDHPGVYPVGVASIVLAENEDQAHELLDAALTEAGLFPPKEHYTLVEVPLNKPIAVVLRDGDY